MNNKNNPKPEGKVCFNCRYMSWCVGVGQGIRCGNKKQWGYKIPSRFHTCEFFEERKITTNNHQRKK